MHPPGGSSSNIFGDPEPAVQRSKQEAASVDTGSPNAAGQSRAKEEGNTQNRLFGDSPAENTPPPAPVAETPPEAPPPQPMEAPQPVEALVEAPGSTTGNRRNQSKKACCCCCPAFHTHLVGGCHCFTFNSTSTVQQATIH